ncbi:MAG: type VI secretion system lipoprotein TssJ [Pseudomonadota bacterium]
MIALLPFLADLKQAPRVLAALLVLALAACSSDDVPPPTGLKLSLVASDEINPQGDGSAAPLVVRLYQLADSGAFMEKTFFEIYDDPVAALGADLLARREYVVTPGSRSDDTVTGPPEVRFIGIIAAFRDIDRAQWRILKDVRSGDQNRIIVGVEALQITFLEPDSSFFGLFSRAFEHQQAGLFSEARGS